MKGDKIVPHAALFNLSEEVCVRERERVSETEGETERGKKGERNELGEGDEGGCAPKSGQTGLLLDPLTNSFNCLTIKHISLITSDLQRLRAISLMSFVCTAIGPALAGTHPTSFSPLDSIA